MGQHGCNVSICELDDDPAATLRLLPFVGHAAEWTDGFASEDSHRARTVRGLAGNTLRLADGPPLGYLQLRSHRPHEVLVVNDSTRLRTRWTREQA